MTEFNNLNEVRSHIDQIDSQIVALIAQRSGCVKQAAQFKNSMDSVKSPPRVEAVIRNVRTLAEEQSLCPELVEEVYRTMIASFTALEMNEYNSAHIGSGYLP